MVKRADVPKDNTPETRKYSRATIAWTHANDALGVVHASTLTLGGWIVNDEGDIAACFVDPDGDEVTCWYVPGYVYRWRKEQP